jgi:nucleotide-binding universal stress UspA family protein
MQGEIIMFHSILVPRDGFAFGEHALPMAMSLARRANASVELLHVLEPLVGVVPELAAYQGPLEVEYRQAKHEYLDALLQRLPDGPDASVTVEMVDGEILPAIHKAAERADLVVMTTHGRGPLGRFWLGSVADQLIREVNRPLLLLHPSKEPPDFSREPLIRRILLPLDGSDLSEQIVWPARQLARLTHATTRLLCVIPTRERMDEVRRYLFGVSERFHSIGLVVETKVVLDTNPATAILREATDDIDLIALATHGYGGLKRLWLGSVADKVIRGSSVPILVQRPNL